MEVRKKTEITVDTDEVLVVRRTRLYRAWCAACGREVDMVEIADAHALTANSTEGIGQGREQEWHVGVSGEMALVCMPSLLKSL
jgi:hypothetical protein